MAYNNSRGSYRRDSRDEYRGSNSRSYGGRDYRRDDYRGGGGNRSRDQKKHSGAKYISKAANDKPCVSAWNYSRRHGMLSIVGSPTSKGMVSEQCEHWAVSVRPERGQRYVTTGFWNSNTGKLTIPDLGMVASTRAPRGGYFGKFSH